MKVLFFLALLASTAAFMTSPVINLQKYRTAFHQNILVGYNKAKQQQQKQQQPLYLNQKQSRKFFQLFKALLRA